MDALADPDWLCRLDRRSATVAGPGGVQQLTDTRVTSQPPLGSRAVIALPVQRSTWPACVAVVAIATVPVAGVWRTISARWNRIDRTEENCARNDRKPCNCSRSVGVASAHASSYRCAAARP